MKNMKYFPFERNKYFYGKLLTVDDFDIEQRYMNDKRRMINRFLYGSGVVCGLNVVVIDDMTISVEPGLALDFSGREMVIDMPVVKKLSGIEGFEAFLKKERNQQYIYLCLDYAETEKEPVHNVTGSGSVEYNRYQENYKLSVTDREPSVSHLSSAFFYENKKTVYEGNQIRITMTAPVYAKAGGESELKLTIENLGQAKPIRFSFDLDLECFEHQGHPVLHISFDEEQYDSMRRYEQVYRINAYTVSGAIGKTELVPGTFELYLGGSRAEAEAEYKESIQIITEDIPAAVQKDYYRRAMEDIVKNNYQQSIYLAKLYVIRAGESYIIDAAEAMPFHQYVYSNVLSGIMNQLLLSGDIQTFDKAAGRDSNNQQHRNTKAGREDTLSVTSGQAVLDLGIGGTVGQRFFSEEITHELGLGNVTIILGQCHGTQEEENVTFGSPEVFEEEVPCRAELAARTNTAKGTFQIGLRLVEPTLTRYVKVNWTALRDPKEQVHDLEEMSLFIKPELLYLKTRESDYLKAVFSGVEPTGIKWTVRDADGGTIEQNGKYTAPNTPGIYEVMAESTVYEKLKASVFIVVRDSAE